MDETKGVSAARTATSPPCSGASATTRRSAPATRRERAGVERQAINAPIQGSASDIIRRAMARMEDALTDAKLSARMLLQVHDELVFEVPEGEVDATLPVVTRVMEDAPHPALTLKVPLAVEARAAGNWEEAPPPPSLRMR